MTSKLEHDYDWAIFVSNNSGGPHVSKANHEKKNANHMKNLQESGKEPSLIDRLFFSVSSKFQHWKRTLRGHDSPAYNRLYLHSRNLKRNLKGKKFNFINVDQASIWTREWIKTFPARYDLIIGVPRSGMLVATIIALKTGKGLTTPELFKEGKFWHSNQVEDRLAWENVKHVLLVDDSVDTGGSMSKAMDAIRSSGHDTRVTKAALIVHEDATSKVDLYHKILGHPRVFEWNILHRKIASYWGHGVLAVDIDGVLCSECLPGIEQEDSRYVEWINSARPYLIPSFEIDSIITNRPEKFRQATENWLRDHNVKYKELHMWNSPDKSDRNGQLSRHKIEELLRLKPDMYWESNWDQAQEIWTATKIPTLCTDNMTLLS